MRLFLRLLLLATSLLVLFVEDIGDIHDEHRRHVTLEALLERTDFLIDSEWCFPVDNEQRLARQCVRLFQLC